MERTLESIVDQAIWTSPGVTRDYMDYDPDAGWSRKRSPLERCRCVPADLDRPFFLTACRCGWEPFEVCEEPEDIPATFRRAIRTIELRRQEFLDTDGHRPYVRRTILWVGQCHHCKTIHWQAAEQMKTFEGELTR